MSSYKWLDLSTQRISESVFVRLCRSVGSSKQVIMRRQMVDFWEIIGQVILTREQYRVMMSGSYKEGFRLVGSDIDAMFWPDDHTVIWRLDQAQNYDLSRKTLILCDSSESPPGFALLKLLTTTQREYLEKACININSRLYISSSKYRQLNCSATLPNSTEHGPCGSGVYGLVEYDHAQCLFCDFWPPPASKWIDRCHSWPPSYIVDDIVRNGCHFVAIGQKLGKHADKEWRISFSLAEQKLVYSMNHCQFLTYGLLKLFLKESINNGISDGNKFLCSYHMKTAVFWMIQQNTMPQWLPQNLLQCFWLCFKLVLKWVYDGVCPNFFIPQNNMFLSNIYGETQNNLFIKLHKLYEKGLESLFQIPSIRSSVLQNPRRSVGIDEHILISKVLLERDLLYELFSNNIPIPDLHQCMRFLKAVEKLMIFPLTRYQVLMLQRITASILQRTAFMFYNFLTLFEPFNAYPSSIVNKQVYMANKISSYMLKLASKFGCISDMLYIAMFYYKTLRYKEAISILKMTKVKLAKPYVMYVLHLPIDVLQYMFREVLGGQFWSAKMRHAVAMDIVLEDEICYINELLIEHQSGLQCGCPILPIPLYVLLHMLEILCYRHVDSVRAQTALNDLQDLVHHDQGMYIHPNQRDISWEILGICQQVIGNHQAALYSYQQSLRHTTNNIQTATFMRMQEIMGHMHRNQ